MEEEFSKLDECRGWTLLYFDIRRKSADNNFSMKEAKSSCNKHLNRYRDVSPYDHTRVELSDCEVDYINASFIDMPEVQRTYILTQGPLENTSSHFWLMCWQQKSKAVIMLNRVIEKNMVKCHRYYPEHEGEELEFEDVGLSVSYLREEPRNFFTIRHLQITHHKSNCTRHLLHFHYLTWPDFGVPSSPLEFLHFLIAVRESDALDVSVHGPPVIHCSAGIGRSGTLCLVDTMLRMIDNAGGDMSQVSIQSVLLKMRESRMGLIQTPDQLRFSYLAVISAVRAAELASLLLPLSAASSAVTSHKVFDDKEEVPIRSSVASEPQKADDADNASDIDSDSGGSGDGGVENDVESTGDTDSLGSDVKSREAGRGEACELGAPATKKLKPSYSPPPPPPPSSSLPPPSPPPPSSSPPPPPSPLPSSSSPPPSSPPPSSPPPSSPPPSSPPQPVSPAPVSSAYNNPYGASGCAAGGCGEDEPANCSETELRRRHRVERQRQLAERVRGMQERQVAHERQREWRRTYLSYLTHPATLASLSASAAVGIAFLFYRFYH